MRSVLVSALLALSVAHVSAFQTAPGGVLLSSAKPSQFRSSIQSRLPVGSRSLRSAPGSLLMQADGEDAPALERFIGCLPYALPLSDTFEWGHYLFDKFPLLAVPFVPLFPIISLLQAPFVSFAIFIALFSFVTRNPSFSRFIRFNTLQVFPFADCVRETFGV